MNVPNRLLRYLAYAQAWLKGPVVIPSYERKREIIQDYLKKYEIETLIETGTFLGDTVAHFSPICKSVFSIELSPQLAAKAQERFKGTANVTILQGDSGEILPQLLNQIESRTLIWLDGHFSGTCGTKEDPLVTARGSSDTPIVQELLAVLNDPTDHVVLIDDARLFTGLTDYPSLRQIRKLMSASGRAFAISLSDDIIHVVPA